MKMFKVNYKDQITKELINETSLLDISESFKKFYNYPILIAKVDNNIKSLSDTISRGCKIDFFDRSSSLGNKV